MKQHILNVRLSTDDLEALALVEEKRKYLGRSAIIRLLLHEEADRVQKEIEERESNAMLVKRRRWLAERRKPVVAPPVAEPVVSVEEQERQAAEEQERQFRRENTGVTLHDGPVRVAEKEWYPSDGSEECHAVRCERCKTWRMDLEEMCYGCGGGRLMANTYVVSRGWVERIGTGKVVRV